MVLLLMPKSLFERMARMSVGDSIVSPGGASLIGRALDSADSNQQIINYGRLTLLRTNEGTKMQVQYRRTIQEHVFPFEQEWDALDNNTVYAHVTQEYSGEDLEDLFCSRPSVFLLCTGRDAGHRLARHGKMLMQRFARDAVVYRGFPLLCPEYDPKYM